MARSTVHDLKEPARMVHAFADLIRQRHGHRMPAADSDLLDIVADSAQHMEKELEDVLEYMRDPHRLSDQPRPVDLAAIVKAVRNELHLALTEADATLLTGRLPGFIGHPGLVHRLLRNLIHNAARFGKEGGVTIRVRGEVTPWQIRIEVADNGIGMDLDHVHGLFQPFRQFHRDAHVAEGTGLGLATCRRIARRLDGEITCDSEPGRGSTFTVRWPNPITKDVKMLQQ